ncbi:NAD(P)/FAD-dependent oxidoreductase [Candidatus Thioglobus autotrophicus]|uniref:NAD(P)/FAD-dependent oxidoreductase n=1 Tax=Candidatus Thioglobus autotrophicus TaxID=1705394 RepID=UPI00299E890C|nr:FAD-dependent oxidoreductase [Candidatus Thioglobus autotrophicus]WPE18612.1 FAD-dependent oxidoreductase [Candidatus Thioglobus autotrophicus]
MSDCLIIGGGVIGMMSARALVLSGAKVTLLDQGVCGQESSWAGGGIISPLYPWKYDDLTNELSLASQAVYEQLCAQILEDTGLDPEYLKSGLLMMDEYDSNVASAWLMRYGLDYQTHEKGGLFTNIAQVRNPRLIKALKADILSKGVKIVENTQVESLLLSHDKVRGVNTSQQAYLSDHVVVCSGAWSSQWLDLKEEIFPMKGQMIVLKSKPGVVEHIMLDQGRYIIPRQDGRILVGSTMQNVGFDRTTDPQTQQSLQTFAVQRFPDLKRAAIEHHWSGFRPASKSGKVMLGRHAEFDNVYLNTGHFRNGLNMAPESAKRITQLITHET